MMLAESITRCLCSMLERHKKRLDEIAHRNSKMKMQTITPVMNAEYDLRGRQDKKRILHDIFQQCIF